ncbi:g8519 [Coccomyxa elongata]
MDEELIRAAEREMRRPAPEVHQNKQRRLDSTPGYSFKELGRFDYRAAETIAEGSQGFIITCHFRREKSATREAMEALQSCAKELAPGTPDVAFSIIKLPCRGVVLLRWQPAHHDAGGGGDTVQLPLPAPAEVVADLIGGISCGLRARLKHAQRISPVHTTCSVSEASVRAAVLRIAAQHAAVLQQNKECDAVQQSSEEHLRHTTVPQETAGEGGTAPQADQVNGSAAKEGSLAEALRVRFAIAFRSRTAEPGPTAAEAATLTDTQKDLPNPGGDSVPGSTSAAIKVSGVTESAGTGTPADGAVECSAEALGSLPDPAVQTSAEVATAPHPAHPNGSSNSVEDALDIGKKRSREHDTPGHTAAASKGPEAGDFGNGESGRQEAERTDLSRERGIAVAAAAFAEGIAKAGVTAVVDLKSPDWVLNVDVLPIGGRSICALCLVSADCVTIRPKLTMKQIGS